MYEVIFDSTTILTVLVGNDYYKYLHVVLNGSLCITLSNYIYANRNICKNMPIQVLCSYLLYIAQKFAVMFSVCFTPFSASA